MAEQLYDRSAYIREFEARVISCREEEGRFAVILDRTAFFPEQGGQYADKGIIWEDREAIFPARFLAPEKRNAEGASPKEVKVLDVQMRQGEVVHLTDGALLPGTAVKGMLDWNDRYDKMQQHTAEHIVSGIVHSRYGYNNVGFHLGEEHVTMDYSGELSFSELLSVEREANEAVWKNLPVLVTYPSEKELENIVYRSKIEIEGQIRIVEIPGYDVCACCAPHVERTGEIGLIKIVNTQRYKGGVRVYMVCGARALADYDMRHSTLREVSNLLSVKDEESFAAAKRLKEENISLAVKLGGAKAELLERRLAEAAGGEKAGACGKGFILFEEGMDKRDLIKAADRMAGIRPGYCGIFNGSDEEGYVFVLASRDKDCRSLANALRGELGAKGGGSALMIQGSVKADRTSLVSLLESF